MRERMVNAVLCHHHVPTDHVIRPTRSSCSQPQENLSPQKKLFVHYFGCLFCILTAPESNAGIGCGQTPFVRTPLDTIGCEIKVREERLDVLNGRLEI